MYLYIHCSIILDGQDMEITKVSFDRWLDKEDVVHIHNGILLIHKKRWNAAICDNMDGSREYHAKQSKSDRKGQKPYDFTHVGYKTESNKWTNKTKQNKTHRHRQQYGGYQRGMGVGGEWRG